jgi:hypothetical protein
MRLVRVMTCCLLASLLLLAGCGSGDEKGTGASDPKAVASSSEKASQDPAEEADADGLVEHTEAGVTLKAPATWKLDKDTSDGTLFIWVNPKCKTCGLVALGVENSTQTAEEYVAFEKGPRGTWRNLVKRQTPVTVEGLGQGYRVHVVYKQNITDHLIVGTMDGLLVHVTSVPDKEHPEYADLVLASVKRVL